MHLDRRLVMISAALLAFSPAAFAQTSDKKFELPDLVIGKSDAPVVIEEYASLTCSHCAAFHVNVLPGLKTAYIDTGKVKLVYRDFPLDELAVAAAMVARCVGDKREAMLGKLYSSQDVWLAQGKNPLESMFTLSEPFGMTRESMEKCLSDADVFNAIVADRDKFEKAVNVEGTPTFVINGKKFDRTPDAAGFDAVLKPLVK
jgi:protein-disulfide isomerase